MVAGLTPAEARPDGLVLEPFRALRYDTRRPELHDLAALTSPPYDVIDDAGVRRLEAGDPHNVVRLILPRDNDGAPGSRYVRAADQLAKWRRGGVLRTDATPALYVYEEATGDHIQRGLVGALSLVPPEDGVVLPHENTMAGPVADRLALTAATRANLEPIFLVYDGGGAASSVVAGADVAEPLLSATTDDGVTHRVWAVEDPVTLQEIAADLRPRRAVIADGHHRYATYLRYQADQRAAGAGTGPWDYGLALLVDARDFGPQVGAIHRVVPQLPVAEAAQQAAAGFTVAEVDSAGGLAALAAAGSSGPALLLAGAGGWFLLTDPAPAAVAEVMPPDRSAAWRRLDVTVAHRLLVERLWGLDDTEAVVGFAHSVAEATAAAAASGGTALLLNPTPVESVVAVAAAAERMPRKSTLFTPKPRTGLLLRAFDDG